MKRVGFYRRNGKNEAKHGLKERIVWQLSKRPMTPTELAEILGTRRCLVVDHLWHMSQQDGVARVSRGEVVKSPDGVIECYYHFEGLGSRIFQKAGKAIVISPNAAKNANPETRKANIEKAKRRARLIEAGLYIDEMG